VAHYAFLLWLDRDRRVEGRRHIKTDTAKRSLKGADEDSERGRARSSGPRGVGRLSGRGSRLGAPSAPVILSAIAVLTAIVMLALGVLDRLDPSPLLRIPR
jgi:hypothetical protein